MSEEGEKRVMGEREREGEKKRGRVGRIGNKLGLLYHNGHEPCKWYLSICLPASVSIISTMVASTDGQSRLITLNQTPERLMLL